MIIFRHLASVFLILLLSSCAVVPGKFPIVQNPAKAYLAHAKSVSSLSMWQARGSLGIRNGQKGQSAHFIWKNDRNKYDIELYGPLGLGASYLKGDGRIVMLITAKKKTYKANNAQDLMDEVLGWSVPVEGLAYWVRGLPMPDVKAIKQYNTFGFLSELKQNGWTIKYLSYEKAGRYALPQRLILTRPNIRIVAVISQWIAKKI